MFKVNMKVSILNESGTYVVRSIERQLLLLEDEYGFTRKIHPSQVCLRRNHRTAHIPIKDSDRKTTSKDKEKKVYRIDLHLENLPEKILDSNHEKLQYQIDSFKKYCNLMFQKKIKQFEVVHGHGKGVLRNELRTLVWGKEGIEMHDNEYSAGMVGSSLIVLSFSKFEQF